MELTTVLELVKAGFTKDEIMQMAQPQTPVTNTEPVPTAIEEPAPTTEPVAVPAQVAEPVTVPVAVPAQTAQPEQNQPTMADIMQGIAKLTSAVQANAIAQSVIPGGMTTPPKAEDMLAEIIRPTFKERA